MANRIDIEDVIFDGIVAATGLPEEQVVWNDQPKDGEDSAPQPTGTYVSLNIISGPRRIGNDDEQRSPKAGSAKDSVSVVGQRELTLSVQAYGTGAGDLIQDVLDYFQKPSINGALDRAQIDVVEIATVIDDVDYQVIVSDDLVSVDSGPGATADLIRDQLIVGINDQGDLTATPLVVPGEPSSLSLDGNGYAKGSATGIFNTAFNVYETKFKPGFTLTDGLTHYIFDADGAVRYAINKGADSILYIRAGGTLVFYVLAGNYATFWNDLDWNELVVTVDAAGLNHKAELNENLLTLNAPIAFTPASPGDMFIGARNTGAERFNGLIDYVRIYAGATEAQALDNLTAGYEFDNNYEGTPATTLVPQGTGNTFVANIAQMQLEGSRGDDVPLTLDEKLAFVSRQAAVDLVYMRDTGETNLTELLDGISFEDRSAVDIFMNTKSIKEDSDTGFIERVEATGYLNGLTIKVEA